MSNEKFYIDDDGRLWEYDPTAPLSTSVPVVAEAAERGPALNPKHIQAMKEGKPPMQFLPFGPLAAVARVMATGAAKYGRRNWLIDKILATTYVAAIFRHAFLEWAAGINKDKDSGEHPLAHVVACCLIVMEAEQHGTLIDDRLSAESVNQKKEAK